MLFGTSLVGFIVGSVYLLNARHPVVNLRVFRDRNFALGTIAIGVMGFVLYASAVIIPQFAQTELGYTATWAGLALAPGALVLIACIPLVGRIMKVVPVKYVIAAGGLALSGALFFSNNLVPNLDFHHLWIFRAAQTAALALLFVPISTAAYITLPGAQHGDGAALFTMSRNVVGGIGLSVSTALITNHQQIRQQYLGEHLEPDESAVQRPLAESAGCCHEPRACRPGGEADGARRGLSDSSDPERGAWLKPLNATVPGLSADIVNGGSQALNQLAAPDNLFQYGLDASWELDLFGRVRRSVEQARAQSQAQSEALNDALIVLESEIVQSYVQLRGAQALKVSQEENVKAAQENLALTQRRQKNGLTTELDVANVRVAVASFYPDISLTGNIGMRALDGSYLTNWASHFYTAGPAISLPIFSGGRLSAGLTLARAEQKEAALNYRATVLNALREVEDALVTYRVDRASRDLLQHTLDSAQLTWDLARNQYDYGLASFVNVLTAQSTVLADRQALVQANVQLVNDIVSLYRALGGGWENTVQKLPNPDVSTTPPPLPGAVDWVADPDS